VSVATELRKKEDIDQLNMDRQVIHAAQNLTNYGRINFDPLVMNQVDMQPDPRFIPAYKRAMENAVFRVRSGDFNFATETSFQNGHENFMHKIIYLAYVYGDEEQAREYFLEAKELYGQEVSNTTRGTYETTIGEFVMDYMQKHMELLDNTGIFLGAMVERALMEGLANSNLKSFGRFMELARMAYDAYHEETQRVNANTVQSRRNMLSFDEIFARRYHGLMQDPNQSPLLKGRIWRNTPQQWQRKLYDRIMPAVAAQCERFELDVARAFPAPEGIEQYRQQRVEEAPEKSTTETADEDQQMIRTERK
jgi:hypothetical protein